MSNWNVIPGARNFVDINDRPRKLNSDEVNLVMAGIPKPRTNNKEVAEFVYRTFFTDIFNQVSQVEICPSELERFRVFIKNKCIDALEPGGNSSIVSTNGMVSLMVQGSLSNFHSSGSRGTSAGNTGGTGVIFNANTLERDRMMDVHLVNKTRTRQEAMDLARKWVTIRMVDIITTHTVSFPRINSLDNNTQKWWYVTNSNYWKMSVNSGGVESDTRLSNSIAYLRLHLDLQKVFNLGLTLDQITSKLVSSTIHVLSGSISDGYIDIIVNSNMRDMASNIENVEYYEMSYLNKFVFPGIQNILISGYFSKRPNDEPKELIRDVEVMTTPLSVFIDIDEGENNEWTLSIDKKSDEYELGVPIDIVGASNVGIKMDEIISVTTEEVKFRSTQNVKDHIIGLDTDIGYNYIRTYGSAYASIMRLRVVDSRNTTTSDVKAMSEVLGIESTRKFMARSVDTIIGSGKISFPHASVIMDIITRTGVPRPLSATTIAAEGIGGIISKATARSALKNLTRGSISKETESTTHITPAVLTGMESGIGTSYNKVVLNDSNGTHKLMHEGKSINVKIHAEIYEKSSGRSVMDIFDIMPSDAGPVVDGITITKPNVAVFKQKIVDISIESNPKSSAIMEIITPKILSRALPQEIAIAVM